MSASLSPELTADVRVWIKVSMASLAEWRRHGHQHGGLGLSLGMSATLHGCVDVP